MKKEEAIIALQLGHVFCSEKYKDAVNMAIRSLEAWDKVEKEIKNDWMFKKYPSAPYTCGLRDSLEVISKHLKEVEK